jgi:hypothetical protein
VALHDQRAPEVVLDRGLVVVTDARCDFAAPREPPAAAHPGAALAGSLPGRV